MIAALVALSLPPQIIRGLPPRTMGLTFHDIIPVRTRQSLWFDCSVSELKSELQWLRDGGAHFISVDQLYRHLTARAGLPTHPVCVTFADNYLGFYTYGYPILRRMKVPVAMFVHTGYVGSRIGRPKMTWDQLRLLDRQGVTIASQTVTHPADIRVLSQSRLAWEMRKSKADLEQELGHRVPYLAYPNGKFNERCEAAAKAAGYLMAFSERLTPAERSPSIFAVARYVHTRFRQGWRDANR